MLEVKNLNVSLLNKKVFANLNFSIEKGQIIGFLGKNGAGKTTLFNSIYGLVKYEGEVFFENNILVQNKVSFIETENYFYDYIKAKEYLSFFNSQNIDIDQLAVLFNIPLDDYVHNFSTGMKKKLAIIANLTLKTPIVIFDEPFNGLDFESVEKLYLLLQKIKANDRIILISSHIFETLKNSCDKIIHIESGVIKNIYLKNEFSALEKTIKSEFEDSFSEIFKNLK